MEQPQEIVAPLLPYQRQFLAWGVAQEQSSVRGGILADEMGMGKTLQVIAILQQVLLYPNGSQIDGSEAVPCVWDFLADGLGCSKTLQVKLSA